MKIYNSEYQIINGLGTEVEVNGEKPIIDTRGDCITWAARFHRASLGMIRLEIMPILMAVWLFIKEPNCSIQPPIKATPNNPNAITPLARVERKEPPKIEMLRKRIAVIQMRVIPWRAFGAL